MKKQNILQNTNHNTIFACGKIIDVNNHSITPWFILFIRNGGERRHTYLKFRYDPKTLMPKRNTTVSIEGHIENYDVSDTTKFQHFVADRIRLENPELVKYFDIPEQSGFAYQKPFAKVFFYGAITNKLYDHKSKWIEIGIRDFNGTEIKAQYSRKMRVDEVNAQVGDYVYLYALPISTKKHVKNRTVNFENLIVEDIVIDT
ncbi:hypothetical protein ACVR1I_03480 [Streptococcus cameli]